jgi:hypothetical protein
LLDRELCNFKCNKTVCTKFVFKKPHPSKLFAAQRAWERSGGNPAVPWDSWEDDEIIKALPNYKLPI